MSLVHLSQEELNKLRPEQVVNHYANELGRMYVERTAGPFSFTGLLNEFHIVIARM